MKRITITYLIGLAVMFFGCGEYNQILKSGDLNYQVEMAHKYYGEAEYTKANGIYEEILPLIKGDTAAEGVYYRHAYCNYYLNQYYLAGFYFNNFVRTYPVSQFSEDCGFMTAICNYRVSPRFDLDQTETKKAIDGFQLYLNRYPETSRKDTCNQLIDQLRWKLEKKEFEISNLYFKTRRYRAALVSYENFVQEYPNSDYNEMALFNSVEASFLLAMNSVESKKMQRLEDSLKSYHKFVDNFPNSKHLKEAEIYYGKVLNEIKKLRNLQK